MATILVYTSATGDGFINEEFMETVCNILKLIYNA